MTTYNTGNPVGSTEVKDLYDNAENLDIAINSPSADAWTDRLGQARKTWRGIQNEAQLEIAQVVGEVTAQSQQYLDASIVARDEARAAASASGPIAFFGTYAAAQAAVGGLPADGIVEVSQDETRAGARTRYKVQAGALVFLVNLDQMRLDLATPSGASLIGGGGQVVSSIAALRALSKTSASKNAFVTGYYSAGDGGGGAYYYDSTDTTTADNGGTVIVAADGGRWKLSFTDWVSVKQFGAKGDGVTDDAPSVIKAIELSKEGKPLMLVYPPSAEGYKQSSAVLVPSYVTIDLGGNNIIGSGGTGFESATWVAGVLTTNIATPAESTLIRGTTIKNGRMTGFLRAIYLQNFIWNCAVEDIEFIDCGWSIHATRCFYSAFTRLNTNGLLAGHADVAYRFDGVNNLLELTGLSVGGPTARIGGFYIGGGAPDCNLSINDCSCENVGIGFAFSGALNSLSIKGCYFENVSDTAINLSGAFNKTCIDIDSNWFYNVSKAVIGRFCLSGRWGRSNQIYTDATHPAAAIVDFADSYENQVVVEIPNTIVFGNNTAAPALPPNYLVGSGCRVDYSRNVVNSAGTAVVVSGITTTKPIPLHYTGTGGWPDSGVVPFCAVTVPAGTSGNVVFDTKIPFDSPDLVGFSLQVVDTNGLWRMGGFITGGGFLVNSNPGGMAVSVANNAGYIRITASGFASTTSTYTVSGAIRIL